jgi:autotransporter-associated beta strand protein
LTGVVYEDLDANGVRNNGENGIPGWTVYLDLDNSGTRNVDAAGTPEPATATDSDGMFVIDHLVPGTYRVAEIVADGWWPTAPMFLDVTVAGERETRADFVNFGPGTIDGTVWSDLDNDGVRDIDLTSGAFVDPGLPGWTVFLDLDDDRALGLSEPWTTTDADGRYAFTGLAAGDYEVTEILPDGWGVARGHDIRQTAAVAPLGTATQDYGNISLVSGSLAGSVWNDADIDGLRDIDVTTGGFPEPGLVDWTVYLDLDRDGTLDRDGLGGPLEPTARTDAAGRYTFTSLAVGDYEATLDLQAGWDASPLFDIRQTVTVRPGRVADANDFAVFTALNGGIQGVAWNDTNRNGVRDRTVTGDFSEPGLSGWTVFLDRDGDGVRGPTEPSETTDTSGHYAFVDLQVGRYEVREILPTGWETAIGFADSVSVRVFSGTHAVAPDFANIDTVATLPATVRGTIWNDADCNGIRVAGEGGLAGRSVFVDLDGDGLLDAGEPSAISAADGGYSLLGIAPGSVSIVAAGTAGSQPTSPVSRVRVLSPKNGDVVAGIDFGFTPIRDAELAGMVFLDANANGIRDAGERGLAGIAVYLDTNGNAVADAGEPRTSTSVDHFYTPSVDEAGMWSCTHLAAGDYAVRIDLPAMLSATPLAQTAHAITLAAGEARGGITTAAVPRPTLIRGVAFDDADGDLVKDPGESGHAGGTVFVDLDRDDLLDDAEPRTTTAADGGYSFTGLPPGAYVIREVVDAGRSQTSPATTGGTLWPVGTSNPAVGMVNPTSITTSLTRAESLRRTVSLTLPGSGSLTNVVDVFLLFDDTGSFVNNSPIVRAAFPTIMAQLLGALPGIDLGFGVGRFEEYASFASEYATGRPFILNQPIVAARVAGSVTAIQAALNRTTPGYGGDQPETDIEALYQLVTGAGFDGNGNGSTLDSGAAGLAATQISPGTSGDVPSFSSFVTDPANAVLPASGSVGGGGFRAGALPVILLATDTGFAYQPKGETAVTGANGLTLPLASLTGTSRATTPRSSGAGLQETVTAVNALGGLVIGLGTNPQPTADPRQGLEALSKLTGAVNRSAATIANGTPDPIAPGDPLYFQIASGFASSVADGVVNAIRNAVTSVAVDIAVQASDPRVRIVNHTGVARGVGAGQTATFDVEFKGDGIPRRFDLQFIREGTGVVLGSIPVVLGTPVPGDCYDYEELEEGEHSADHDFGSRSIDLPTDDVVLVGAGVDETVAAARSGNVRIVKRGAGGLVITVANTHSGGTVVEDGRLVVRHASGLGTGGLAVRSTGSATCEVAAAEIAISSLAVDAGGRLDLGAARLRIAAGGYTLAQVVSQLGEGHAGGWSAASGIVSSAAASTAARSVGYRVNDDGSLSVAYAAPGDTNLDGFLDVLDASNFIASSAFNASVAADWMGGDFNYDGMVDLLDAADFISGGLFDAGGYLPAGTASGGATEVMAPSLSAADLAFAAFSAGDTGSPSKKRAGRATPRPLIS